MAKYILLGFFCYLCNCYDKGDAKAVSYPSLEEAQKNGTKWREVSGDDSLKIWTSSEESIIIEVSE